MSGVRYVPRLCSWCYLVASDSGWCSIGRYRTAPFAYWYRGARTTLFAFLHRDAYCSLFRDHGLDFGKMRVVVATSGIKILLYVSTANLGLFGAVCFATRAINSH